MSVDRPPYSQQQSRSSDFAQDVPDPSTSSHYQRENSPLPPLPDPQPGLQSRQDEYLDPHQGSTLVKVPRLSKRQRAEGGNSSERAWNDSNVSNEGDGDKSFDAEGSEDDLSEGECEAQMRKIRRSLSIERRFEQAAEEERPRLLRNGRNNGSGNGSGSGPGSSGMLNDPKMEVDAQQDDIMFSAAARRKDGWSFTATADAWSK